MITQTHEGKADNIIVKSDAPKLRLTITMPRRRPLMFTNETKRKFTVSVK